VGPERLVHGELELASVLLAEKVTVSAREMPYRFLQDLNVHCMNYASCLLFQIPEQQAMLLPRDPEVVIGTSGGAHVIIGDVCQLAEAFGSSRRQ